MPTYLDGSRVEEGAYEIKARLAKLSELWGEFSEAYDALRLDEHGAPLDLEAVDVARLERLQELAGAMAGERRHYRWHGSCSIDASGFSEQLGSFLHAVHHNRANKRERERLLAERQRRREEAAEAERQAERAELARLAGLLKRHPDMAASMLASSSSPE